jgi:hypothetical protein
MLIEQSESKHPYQGKDLVFVRSRLAFGGSGKGSAGAQHQPDSCGMRN